MRLGGPFTLNPAGSYAVTLAGGQYFYPPPGNYLLVCGTNTVPQWWDPVGATWRTSLSKTLELSADGYNFRILNTTGIVTGAGITTAGTGGTNGIGPTQTGTSIAFAAGTGAVAKGYVVIGGALSAPTITQAGSGFLVPPLILIDPPPYGGVQATAIAGINAGGQLNSVTLVGAGAGYLAPPNFYVVPQFLDYPGAPALPYTIPSPPTPVAPNAPPGVIALLPPQQFANGLVATSGPSGALITSGALTGSGGLTAIVMTNNGSGYAAAPGVTFAGGTLGGTPAATAAIGPAAANDTSFFQMFNNE